jgi:hypothetical protein
MFLIFCVFEFTLIKKIQKWIMSKNQGAYFTTKGKRHCILSSKKFEKFNEKIPSSRITTKDSSSILTKT